MIRTGNNSETIYASSRFMVENYPDQNATELIKVPSPKDGKPPTVSHVMFKGMDSMLFLGGFTDALDSLPEGEVDEAYLNAYAPLMQRRLLQ